MEWVTELFKMIGEGLKDLTAQAVTGFLKALLFGILDLLVFLLEQLAELISTGAGTDIFILVGIAGAYIVMAGYKRKGTQIMSVSIIVYLLLRGLFS